MKKRTKFGLAALASASLLLGVLTPAEGAGKSLSLRVTSPASVAEYQKFKWKISLSRAISGKCYYDGFWQMYDDYGQPAGGYEFAGHYNVKSGVGYVDAMYGKHGTVRFRAYCNFKGYQYAQSTRVIQVY